MPSLRAIVRYSEGTNCGYSVLIEDSNDVNVFLNKVFILPWFEAVRLASAINGFIDGCPDVKPYEFD